VFLFSTTTKNKKTKNKMSNNDDNGTPPPTPSLLSALLPMIRELDDFLGQSATAIDRLMLWDARAVNHEGLLQSMNELSRTHEQFLTAISAKLQSLWLRESQRYGTYVRSVDRTLSVRHSAELENAFPRLRMGPEALARVQHDISTGRAGINNINTNSAKSVAAAVTQNNNNNNEQHLSISTDGNGVESVEGVPVKDIIAHLAAHGFEYDATCRRLVLLVLRQMKENSVLRNTSASHQERILEAKRADLSRLDKILRRSSQAVEALISGAQRKIAASRTASVAASAVYMGSGGGVSAQQQQQKKSATATSTTTEQTAKAGK
jgi:hypothetical protein